jgi:Holliday junction endodeoxyribonuclease RuvC-like protein
MSKKILGLDISSSTVGYGVLSIDGYKIDYIDSGWIKPSKKGTIFDRLEDARRKIEVILHKYQPDFIGIEDIVQFMPDKTSANTVITLAIFNRVLSMLVFDFLSAKHGQPTLPLLLNVLAIRHGIKLSPDLPDKSDIPELVAQRLGITFPYDYKKSGEAKTESFDEGDGIAVSLYYAMILTGQKILKIKKKQKRKNKKNK